VVVLLLVLGAVLALTAPACSSSNPPKAYVPCAQNSDCDTGLICTLGGLCRPKCRTAADCGDGGACVTDGMGNAVCQSKTLNNKPCDTPGDCPAPLACASDYRCRNLCMTSNDCNAAGIMGRVCAQDMNGVNYCATMSEVTQGAGGITTLTATPAPGHVEAGVIEPDASNTGQPEGGGKDGTSGGMDGMMTMMGGDSGADTGTSGDGSMMATCSPACGVGKQCVNGTCMSCGVNAGDPCCGNICNPNLTCTSAGKCACGDPGQACCSGTSCNNGVTCASGMCACGKSGQACCPASDGGAASCSSGLQCAGIDCGCVLACSNGIVQDSSGALYSAASTPITTTNGSKFLATSFDATNSNYGCGVKSDGTVWCWGSNNYGQLGVGSTMPSSSTIPLQVLTGASGPPLSNASKVFVDGYYSYTACAVDSSGNAWCWGYGGNGVLGTGNTNNSPFAVQVQQQGGGAFTGVADMSVAEDHVCARKTDNSLYCWGSNNYGQIGAGSATQMQYLNPTQVTTLQTHVTSISVGVNSSCATDDTGYVWCWGYNGQGILGNGLRTGNAYVPAQVAVGDAGTPFGGASQVEVLYAGYGACVLKTADRSIWCWGYYSQNNAYYPTQSTESMVAVTGVFVLCNDQQQNSSNVSFIDGRGAFHNGGTAWSTQVSCP
jgi:hypothetical protein